MMRLTVAPSSALRAPSPQGKKGKVLQPSLIGFCSMPAPQRQFPLLLEGRGCPAGADEGVSHHRNSRAGKEAGVFVRFLMLLVLFLAATPAFAVNPDEVLPDPALEARARIISAELRCMVCQNQSIDDSNADLARDLRLLVRKRLTDGDTDRQVLDYIVSRYGEFVLLKPRFSQKTVILWGAPIVLFVAGGLALAVYARRRSGKPTGQPLNAEEEAELNEILGK